ncbi:helix-turn-helix domain-containing protein [Streptomyces gamaensis]|uniref:Helix-turn-helix domain-containing protein n=1 Tax=Streptomyces gamaensis TaxID=1763542 RepID=A0ABW0Z1B2_9ACTN
MDDQTTVTALPSSDTAELASRTPHPLLAGHAVGYTGQDFQFSQPLLRRVTALATVVVVIDFEHPDRHYVTDAAGRTPRTLLSPVTGLTDRPTAILQGGHEYGLTAVFTPLGARALFGLPLSELANRSVGLTDLLGADGRRLTERLAEAPGWAARFRLLDDYLLARIGSGPELPVPVRHAWHQLTALSGNVTIGALADEVGWSRQHLNARFRQETGLSPKTVARITRLQRAVSLMHAAGPRSWAETAALCGYTDQPHLNRDFRLLTGHAPGAFHELTGDWSGVVMGDPRLYTVDPGYPRLERPDRGA